MEKRNCIVGKCDVHHRDDNDEVITYNNTHYERWGFNEDGTFEYGKYVLFMTHSEHTAYHNKHISAETHAKLSAAKRGERHPRYGKHLSDIHRARISASNQGVKILFNSYKQHGGILEWNDFRKALTRGDIIFEMRPITVLLN